LAPRFSTVALVALLAVDGVEFCLATTHLKAKPGFEERRARQAAELLEIVGEVAAERPVVLAGDFNDIPDSPACELIRSHRLGLRSAYLDALGREPDWTTWKIRAAEGEVRRTIDYIWYRGLELKGVLSIPPDAQVESVRLPSWQYPSDHLSLMATFLGEKTS